MASGRHMLEWLGALLMAAGLALVPANAQSREPGAKGRRSGTELLSPTLKAQQADDGANPGMLWVERGQRLWTAPPAPQSRTCASCHGDDGSAMTGVATRYPRVDGVSGRLLNLEGRINACRGERQAAAPLDYESDDLLALTAFVAHQSRGLPIDVSGDGPARPHYLAGEALYRTPQGQLDLACAQCHDDHAGRRLRGDIISQAHPTGYPIYRLEWNGLGSLHRRLKACAVGVRAVVPPAGSAEHLALELYLAVRANGLAVETPAIRK